MRGAGAEGKRLPPVMTYEQYFHHEEVCTRCTTPLQKPFVYLCIPASRYVEYTSGILSSPTESAFLVPRMSAWAPERDQAPAHP